MPATTPTPPSLAASYPGKDRPGHVQTMDRAGRMVPLFPWLWLWFRVFTWRHWSRAPRQNLLLLAILTLGIAVYVAIRLANQAAVAGFQTFTEVVAAESDWVLTSRAGPLPDTVLMDLRAPLGDESVDWLPILETTASPPGTIDEQRLGTRPTYQVLGLDLIAIQNFAARAAPKDRGWFESPNSEPTPANAANRDAFWSVFTDPHSVFVNDALARQMGLQIGDRFPLIVQERRVELRVAGMIPALADKPGPPANLLVMDLPALQQLAGRDGELDRIEFFVEPGPGYAARRESVGQRLQTWLDEAQVDSSEPTAWQLTTSVDRRAAAALMTRAFRLNLTLLSLLALGVGLYLIFQALDGAVVRRRGEISILRALGVPERGVWGAWLIEALVLGLTGGVLGIAFGWIGAQWAVVWVGQTVNALYHATESSRVLLTPTDIALGLLLALSAGLMAGWLPAQLAARTPPAQLLGRISEAKPVGRLRLRTRTILGALCLLIASGLVTLDPWHGPGGIRIPIGGYTAALLGVVGCGFLGGACLRLTALLLRRWPWKSPWPGLAQSQLIHPSGRHQWAVASLLCAVALTSGMAILVASFDVTMRGWIERTFQADLYLSSDGAQSASSQHRILPETWEAIVGRNEVTDANVLFAADVSLQEGITLLVGADLRFALTHSDMTWAEPPRVDGLGDPERNRKWVWVSESFQQRFGIGRGERVRIPTPSGWKTLEVVAVFSDYGNERGSLIVDQEHWREWFGHNRATSLILKLQEAVDPGAFALELRREHPGLTVLTNRHLREEILRIFRQTFAITYALEWIGLVVAVAGLGITLASILVDRRRELTTLRALGARPSELAWMSVWEGLVLSGVGALLGLGLSVALGWILIFIINKQTFGWTLSYVVPIPLLLGLVLVLGLCGGGVSYAVGRWGADLAADRED